MNKLETMNSLQKRIATEKDPKKLCSAYINQEVVDVIVARETKDNNCKK